MNIKKIIEKYKIEPDVKKDQFFLINEVVIDMMVNSANLNLNDTVLEIGTGIGNITRKIANKAGKVITFEIDEDFNPVLKDLPSNVELHFENARKYMKLNGKWIQKKEYNKVISNIPYSFIEQFLHNLTFLTYEKVILLIPKKLMKKIETHPIFGSFFKVEVLMDVDKHNFYPVPRTNSTLINLVKLSDPIKNKNLPLFLRQYMYQHEGQKVRNSLTQGLVTYYQLTENRSITKNNARDIINNKITDISLLQNSPDSRIYNLVASTF
jgi:16S rRNA (adenine1518-N6/adenine1519-N6)-dimethyltransferase